MGWVGLGQSADWLGGIGSNKMDPWTTLACIAVRNVRRLYTATHRSHSDHTVLPKCRKKCHSCVLTSFFPRGFKLQPRCCRVTVLGKLFTSIVPLFTKQQIGSSSLKGCEGGGKLWQPTAGFMTHVTCRLTAKNRDQLRNPTLGNRVWATFTFTYCMLSCECVAV